MSFASVYPRRMQKAAKKGRTKEEIDDTIAWLRGHRGEVLRHARDTKVDFETFFARAPRMNPNAVLFTGVVCGVRVEDVAHRLMKKTRCLDRPIDELAQKPKMASSLREERAKNARAVREPPSSAALPPPRHPTVATLPESVDCADQVSTPFGRASSRSPRAGFQTGRTSTSRASGTCWSSFIAVHERAAR